MSLINAQSEILNCLLSDALKHCCPALVGNSEVHSAHAENLLKNHLDFGHVMFTISAIEFRAAVFLHYQSCENAKSIFLKLNNVERGDPSELDWKPYYTELGNLLCGRVKRYFQQQFEYLGMSTPWVLSPSTVLVDLTSPQLTARGHCFFLEAGLPLLGASLYFYSGKPLALASASIEPDDEYSSGELEFF
jgi:hypothetical protein